MRAPCWFFAVIRAPLLAGLLALSMPTQARDFTVDDLMATEGIGRVLVSPSARWLVFERKSAFSIMPRHDMLMQNSVLRSTPYVVDLASPGLARPLLNFAADGTILLGFSPDGERLAVARLQGPNWRLGVVVLASRRVEWFDLSPDYSPFATTFAWLSRSRIALLVQKGKDWPWFLRDGHPEGSPTIHRWAQAKSGLAATATVIGSGRYRQRTPDPSKKMLVVLDVETGHQRVLDTGAIESFSVSPDGGQLALVKNAEIIPSPAQHDLSPITPLRRRRLILLDTINGMVRNPCPLCDVAGPPTWSPDGAQLAMLARQDGEQWAAARITTVDPRTHSARPVGGPFTPSVKGLAVAPTGAPIEWRKGELLSYGWTTDRVGDKPSWFVLQPQQSKPLAPAIHDQAPALVSTAACATTMIATSDIWCLDSAEPVRVATGVGTVVADASGTTADVIVRQASGDFLRLGNPAGTAIRAQASDRIEEATAGLPSSMVLLRRVGPGQSSALVLVDRGRSITLTSLNKHLSTVRPAQVRSLHHHTLGGADVTSWLVLPPDSANSSRLPMVVIPYAGRSYGREFPGDQQLDSGSFLPNAQLLAARGYAVLLPSMPDLPLPERGARDLAGQVGLAVDAAIETGQIDPDRLALWGQSFGGYSAALIASQTDRYKAVVASAGLYDLASIAGAMTPASRASPEQGVATLALYGWLETGQAALVRWPWENPGIYAANSPFYRADKIHTPMLLTTSDWDIAPTSQAEEMFGALLRQNKDAMLVTYWGEGHVIGGPANVRDLYDRVSAWLATYLSPDE